jgi:hypothetical protein
MRHFIIKPKLQTALCLGSVLLAFACSSGNQTSDNDPASTAAESAHESAQAVASNFKAEDHDECDRDDGCPSDDGDYMGDDDVDAGGDDMDDDGDMDDGDDCDRDDGCPSDDDTDDSTDAGAPGTPNAPDGSIGSCGSPSADAGSGDGG